MQLFISYAREDEAYRHELSKHLSALKRQKVIADWHDRKIVAGQHWGDEISNHLQSSAVILLLVSPDFVASDYCWEREMVHALAMEKAGDAVVIPVIIRPVYWEGAPFAHLHALPTDAKPLSRWDDRDEAWLDVVRGIRSSIERFRAAAARRPPAEPGPREPAPEPAPLLQPSPAGAGTGGTYGDVAVLATELYRTGHHSSPRAAWDEAAHRLLRTTSLRDKGCPRATFLSLAQEGWIPGIPAAEYTRSRENRDHAVAAVRELSADPALADSRPGDLWGLVLGGVEKQHNHQMDVVQALWRNRLIDAEAVATPQPSQPLGWLGVEGEQLLGAFKQVFGDQLRPFGSRSRPVCGLSDGNEGVQWNVGYNRVNGSWWVGVNLEGMEYHGWPIARLIWRELGQATLPGLVRGLGTTDPVEIRWKRDYWQAASRPDIRERAIAPTPVLASRLTGAAWREALEGAAACLASSAGGRTTQQVTLSNGKQVTGPVSPHLTIAFPSNEPGSRSGFLAEARERLQPFYDWAVERSM